MKDWLTHRVRTSPDRTALVAAETGEERSYGALDDEATALAGRLAALGVRSGDHVGTLVGTRPVAVELVHAVMRLGAVLVPFNRRLTAGELTGQIETAEPTVLVCDAETEGTAVDAAGPVPVVSVDEPERGSVERLGARTPEAVAPADWARSDTLALVFTSGTTGPAKAVRLTMGNVLSSAVASAFRLGVTPEDRWLVALSLYHMGGLAPLYRSTIYGTTVVLREEFEPGATADDIATHDVTGVSLVPTMLKEMLDSRGTLATSLRFVLLGGAPASEELVRRCRDYSVPVHPTYGMTETASQISTALPEEAFDHPGTVGRALLWTDLTVVDPDGTPVEAGETGEIVVSGPTVTPGYYGNDEATAAAFGPYGLHTGDAGYVDEGGRAYVRNRLDDRIVTGGENVDPGEVVDALRAHPDVADAAVVGLPDETWGERVSALVVPRDPESGVAAAELEAHCRERLAGYKLPRRIAFADALPRTASGTVARNAVEERLLSVEGDGEVGGEGGDDGGGGGDRSDAGGTDAAAGGDGDADGAGTRPTAADRATEDDAVAEESLIEDAEDAAGDEGESDTPDGAGTPGDVDAGVTDADAGAGDADADAVDVANAVDDTDSTDVADDTGATDAAAGADADDSPDREPDE